MNQESLHPLLCKIFRKKKPNSKILITIFANFPICPNKPAEEGRLLVASAVVPVGSGISLKLWGIGSEDLRFPCLSVLNMAQTSLYLKPILNFLQSNKKLDLTLLSKMTCDFFDLAA